MIANKNKNIFFRFLLQDSKMCVNLQPHSGIELNGNYKNYGSIAQLVQSTCLTSRGSQVQVLLLPQNKNHLH